MCLMVYKMFKPPFLCVFLMILCVFYGHSAGIIRGLSVIPERAAILYYNDKYVGNDTKVNVRRSSRRGSYVINVSGTILRAWTNNVSITINLFEYLHNEYKPTFVKLQYRYCDFINFDPYIGRLLREYGIKCPLSTGFQAVVNGTISFPTFPYVFPFEKCKAEIVLKSMESTEELMAKWELFLIIKQITLKH